MRRPPIRILIADDRIGERAALSGALAGDASLIIAAEAAVTGLTELIFRCDPDVVLLGLDGGRGAPVSAELRKLMARRPCPVLALCRGDSETATAAALHVLEAGAVDACPWPRRLTPAEGAELARRLRLLSGVAMVSRRPTAPHWRRAVGNGPATRRVVGIVASTGGPPALHTLLRRAGSIDAPILVVQHMHPDFVEGFAEWLGVNTGGLCILARDGQRADPGVIHIAPPHTHLRLGANHRLELSEEPESLHRPSGDVLLNSISRHAGRGGVGVVLTGMGEDGARGLHDLLQAGGTTFAQDEASSAVYGMPRAAARLGAAARIGDLEALGGAIAAAVRESAAA